MSTTLYRRNRANRFIATVFWEMIQELGSRNLTPIGPDPQLTRYSGDSDPEIKRFCAEKLIFDIDTFLVAYDADPQDALAGVRKALAGLLADLDADPAEYFAFHEADIYVQHQAYMFEVIVYFGVVRCYHSSNAAPIVPRED